LKLFDENSENQSHAGQVSNVICYSLADNKYKFARTLSIFRKYQCWYNFKSLDEIDGSKKL